MKEADTEVGEEGKIEVASRGKRMIFPQSSLTNQRNQQSNQFKSVQKDVKSAKAGLHHKEGRDRKKMTLLGTVNGLDKSHKTLVTMKSGKVLLIKCLIGLEGHPKAPPLLHTNQPTEFADSHKTTAADEMGRGTTKTVSIRDPIRRRQEWVIRRNLRRQLDALDAEDEVEAVNKIMFNEESHIVAIFKEYLIYDDCNEFLHRYYRGSESRSRLG